MLTGVYFILSSRSRAAVYFCLLILGTRERVGVLFETYLVCRKIFFKLILYVFCYYPFISPYRIYIISSAPEAPLPILVFKICMPIEYHQRTFSLEISHELCYTYMRWNTYEHMDVVRTRLCFYYFHPFLCAQFPQYFSDIFSYLSVYLFSSIFGCEYDTILNHTDLYEYKHGKMLMHLHFCFEGVPTEQTPAAMLKYYRQRKCLTTRQLAESVGIAPATVLMYERERFPIPYQTAVAMAEILEIDRNMLFDEFAQFMDYPYSDRLREIRKAHRLNQATFAEKAGISLSIYSKWEGGSRQPSRKMFRQLVNTYPEINI